MTYYDFVNSLSELSNVSRNGTLYNKVINTNLELYTDMKYRFSIKIIEFVSKKLHTYFANFLNKISNTLFKFEEFSILTSDLKNELDYISSFCNIKCLPSEFVKDIKDLIMKLFLMYNDIIVKLITDVYGDKYLNEYNSILSSYLNDNNS